MQEKRRSFLKWAAALSLIPFAGTSLFAQPAKYDFETIGCTHLDGEFDPDGWL